MSDRDVRDLITSVWAAKLKQAGARNPDALALELAVITEAHGVRLVRPAHLHDPDADFRNRPEEVAPPSADYLAAKAAITGGDAQNEATR